jgi:hypothetical protein
LHEQLVTTVHKGQKPPEFAEHAMQVAEVVAPTVGEYVPDPHEVHKVGPMIILYLPAAQAVHTPPLGPV